MTSIRKREWTTPNGEKKTAWLVDYRDSSGARRCKQFVRKRDADAWSTTAAWEVSQGTHTPDSQSITIADAADQWLARARREGLERGTIKSYDQLVRLHIKPLIGAEKLSRVTKPRVEILRDTLVETRSRAMAGKVMRALAMIITEAQRRGLVAQNVAARVQVRRQKRDRPKPVIPTKAEMRAMIEAAASSPFPMDKPLVLTAIFAGLRGSELRGLRWSDVDLKAAMLTVSQRADEWGVIGPPKSAAGHRTVPLAAVVVAELRKWKLRCPNGELGLVFPTGTGTVESHANLLNRHFWPLQIRAGVCDTVMVDGEAQPDARYSLHALRHCAASLWIEQRISPKRIQTWIGHSSIQMTFDVYGHLFEQVEADANAMAAVESALLA